MQPREQLSSWQQLTKHAQLMKNQHMKELFAKDTQRFSKLSIKLPSILRANGLKLYRCKANG